MAARAAKKAPAKAPEKRDTKFKKGVSGNPKGRGKGVQNKVTVELKQSLLNSFHKLGGEEYLVKLGKTHPQVYGALLGKVLPLQVNATVDATPTFAKLMTEALNIQREQLAQQQNGSKAKVINGSAEEVRT